MKSVQEINKILSKHFKKDIYEILPDDRILFFIKSAGKLVLCINNDGMIVIHSKKNVT